MPLLNKENKKEISAIQDLIEAKVYVNPERREELLALREQLWSLPLEEVPGGATCTLLCLNLSDKVEEALRSSLPGWTLQVERICDDPEAPEYKDDRKRFVKLFSGKALEGAGVAAIVHELRSQDDELTQLDKRIIALSLLSKLPVVSCSCSSANALPAASAATGDTWPVFFTPHPHEDVRPMAEWLREELPRVRALSTAVTAEVQARTEHLGKVNAPLHFLKRGAVALVPFGVLTVNTLGIVRLMANMLQLSGMRGDTSANKALGLLGAENAALVSAVDSLGDVYSFAVFATVLADLQGMGFVEAAEAMDVVDGLTLGSIGVVTGAVSALGAYLSRPVMVRSAGQFLASLQTIYALNPAMRRETLERKKKKKRHGGRHKPAAGSGGGAGAGAGASGDKEELRGLLQRSTAGGKTREQKQEGKKKKGHKVAHAHTGLEERHGAAAAALAAVGSDLQANDDDDEDEDAEDEEPTAQSGSESGNDEGELDSSAAAGEAQNQGASASAAAAAAVAAASAAAAAEDVAAAAEQAAARAEAEAAAAEAGVDAGSLATASTSGAEATGSGTGKLTREEKKQLALARRAAAAEAKAKAAEAKAAAKAAAAAAKAAEKERLAAEKAAAKEAAREAKARKAEEKAAAREEAKAAKTAAAAAKAAEKERVAVEKAAAKEAARVAKEEAKAAKAGAKALDPSTSSIVGPEGWQEVPAAAAPKLKWWQRGRKGAAAAAGTAAGAAGATADAGTESGVEGPSSSGVSGSDESGWGLPVLGGAVGGSAGERDVEDATARDERMGLDAETRAALAQFLSLEEEDVYGADEDGGGGAADGLAAAGVAGGALRPLGSRI